MREPLFRKLGRLAAFVAAFLMLSAVAGLLSVMFIFNVHGGLLPIRLAPIGYALEVAAALFVAWRIATFIVPKARAHDVAV